MCRLLAYLGNPIKISEILLKPAHSLIKQSIESQESTIMVNGDGFGISWYVPGDPEPALFKTVNPAWNEPNLHDLCRKMTTHCLMAHIRAATLGNISRNNSHPFRYHNLALMHNGEISGFLDIKRSLRNLLCDETYNWIEGHTDTEHFFALLINFIIKMNVNADEITNEHILIAYRICIATIIDLLQQHSDKHVVSLNTIITNGTELLATRYANDPNEMRTLYYMTGNHYQCIDNGHTILTQDKEHQNAQQMIILASERLSDHNQEWLPIPPNHYLSVKQNEAPVIAPLDIPTLSAI